LNFCSIIFSWMPVLVKTLCTMMKSNDQSRSCHAERSEASGCPSREILRFAQDDKRTAMIPDLGR
jgi:hypothetical protein